MNIHVDAFNRELEVGDFVMIADEKLQFRFGVATRFTPKMVDVSLLSHPTHPTPADLYRRERMLKTGPHGAVLLAFKKVDAPDSVRQEAYDRYGIV